MVSFKQPRLQRTAPTGDGGGRRRLGAGLGAGGCWKPSSRTERQKDEAEGQRTPSDVCWAVGQIQGHPQPDLDLSKGEGDANYLPSNSF